MSVLANVKNIIINNNDRINWDEYFMSVAYLLSSRSACSRLNVGCVLVKDTRIISAGYNGFLPGAPHESIVINNHEQATVHAEQNAISDPAKRGVSVTGTTAYITHYPCINCLKILLASGIKNIVYSEDYKNDPCVTKIIEPINITLKKLD